MPGRRGTAAGAGRDARDEAFRVLRSNLLVAVDELRNPVVVVTSPQAGEGKTSTCVALATSLALAGARVALVDLDLRKPDAHRLLGTAAGTGVVDVLRDGRPLGDGAQRLAVAGSTAGTPPLTFVPAGGTVTDPAELLGSPAARALLDELAGSADLVLLDTPPVLPVADTLVVGRLAAGAVLVIESRRTPVPVAARATSALIRTRTRLLGVVLNQLHAADAAAYPTRR